MNKILKLGIALVFFVSLVLMISCARNKVVPSAGNFDPRSAKLFALYGKGPILHWHITPREDLYGGKDVEVGESIGTVMPYPETFSKVYNKEILKSKELYAQKNYQEAANILKVAIKREPDNPFILEAYAKALYWQDLRQESFAYYKRLIELLDSTPKKLEPDNAPANAVVLDSWFQDAYWKYGTLLLDMGEWESAALEISRCLAMTQHKCSSQPAACIQAYSYLTEAYFEMKQYNIAKYYAEVTLKMDPANQYVKSYVSRMP